MISAGIFPEKALWLSRRNCNFVSSPIHSGKLPKKLFHARSKNCRPVHLCKNAGNFPDKLLLLRGRNSLVSKHRGISPSIRLFDKSRSDNRFSLHKDPGILPLILFEYISNVYSCRAPRFEGSVPENELLDMSKMEIFLGSGGIGPLKQVGTDI